jgi:tryptophan synthase alpha chain
MSVIDDLFRRLRREGRKAFIPFVTAGDPNLEFTARLIRELGALGADLIEIGFPYSDPIADGPIIQASYTRALNQGIRLDDVFAMIASCRNDVPSPLVGMVSYSLIYRRSPDEFIQRARSSGLSGLIVPDLPAEEAEDFAQRMDQEGLSPILLVAPTTPPNRLDKILKVARGFLYCMSVTGITGERDRLPSHLQDYLGGLRRHTELPLCVGFGVSRPEHAALLRDWADGVIVGSAIVRRLESADTHPAEALLEVRKLVESLMAALNPESSLTTAHPK